MTIFFTIIFIAELIITSWLISLINKCKKWAIKQNAFILEYKKLIQERITEVRTNIKTIHTNLDNFSGAIEKKKEDFLQIFSKDAITTIGYLVLNTNLKSIITFVDLILTLKKLLKKK